MKPFFGGPEQPMDRSGADEAGAMEREMRTPRGTASEEREEKEASYRSQHARQDASSDAAVAVFGGPVASGIAAPLSPFGSN